MTHAARALLLLASVLFGCGGSGSGDRPAEPASWSAAPDQYTCTTDRECVLAPWHFDDEPCCNASYTSVQSRGFVTWRDRWQAAECADVDCDAVRGARQSSASPQQPLPCYFEPRCTRGQCGGSCGE